MNINFKYLILSLLFALSIIGILFFGYIFIINIPKINISIPKTESISEIPNTEHIKTNLNQTFAIFNKNFNSNSENINQINSILETGSLTSEEVANRFLDVMYTERFGIKKPLSKKLAYALGFSNNCKNGKCFSKNSIDAFDAPLKDRIQNRNFSYVKIKNGPTYAFTYIMSECKTEDGGYNNGCGFGYVDINGNKKPNILNVDIFQFRLIRDSKTGYIKMLPYYNENNYPKLYQECYINGNSCTNYALHGITSYITNRRFEACQRKSKKAVWLDRKGNCCINDSTKSCCEANTDFQPKKNGHFVEKNTLGAIKNTCCYNKNSSELCCKALTGADGYLLNGKCISGTIKTPLEKNKFNFVLQSNSPQGSASLLSDKETQKLFTVSGIKTVKMLNLDVKQTYILNSNYENYGAKLKIVRGSCKLKDFGNNYYVLTNIKAGETCIVGVTASKNTVINKSEKIKSCVDCKKEIKNDTHLPCCK